MSTRRVGAAAAILIAVGVAAIAVVLLVALGAGGGPNGDEPDRGDATDDGTPAVAPVPPTPDRRLITLVAHPAEQARVRPMYADLSDREVLRVAIERGDSASGTIAQCAIAWDVPLDRLISCGNEIPVVADEFGRADVLYQVVDTGKCGSTDRCVVVARFPADDQIAAALIVFGDPPPELTVDVEPAGPYVVGDEVGVDVTGAVPGATLWVQLCSDVCADPVVGTASSDGSFTTTVEIGDDCKPCGLGVSTGPREFARALTITDGPGASYSPRRLVSGLAAAIGFLVAAALIVRRTDWKPPSEAATPAFDGPWQWDDPRTDD